MLNHGDRHGRLDRVGSERGTARAHAEHWAAVYPITWTPAEAV
jgi:hypothetical protein